MAVVGLTLAFAANAVSPRGLKLTRNYFPGGSVPQHAPGRLPEAPANAAATNNLSSMASLAAALKEKGLQLADAKRALELFHDPGYEQGLIAFIDARSEEHYKEGHIPGAYEFDHFHPENYLTTVLPACQAAQQIVVYCDGGDCELSEHAALFLRDSAGIPKEKLLVYTGGISEWRSKHLPIEIGERNSGQLQNK